ncbi:cytochrome c-type biogenesis protein [Amycolatopsis keratiniphila]|uniref:cytochrome c-type biogenesis protein n=1 Tax=Amycolatopsis keratiniphila TaxID=129921 RepID=UPI00087C9C0E|nr:cytochrome c-type biogenesis protein [Amycolatopsis keratiniphila]OLZ43529.1 cytochrome C biosynthesis protein [Amycolatopsis keratiniphila subsp. nogabecina]SDU11135.1 cytochrome c-type biogenesis protein CcmH [Amycolatopsis keratiniphila]
MRSRVVSLACIAGVLILLGIVTAQLMNTGGQEDRAYELEQRLRCPVCKSVSIAESPSETATAMRRVVQEQVAAGRDEEEIVGYFRSRYGDWVLLDPPAHGPTLLLWLLPVAGVLAGAAGLGVFLRRRQVVLVVPEDQRDQIAQALERTRAQYRREDLL